MLCYGLLAYVIWFYEIDLQHFALAYVGLATVIVQVAQCVQVNLICLVHRPDGCRHSSFTMLVELGNSGELN
jgi:hypothetical protein